MELCFCKETHLPNLINTSCGPPLQASTLIYPTPVGRLVQNRKKKHYIIWMLKCKRNNHANVSTVPLYMFNYMQPGEECFSHKPNKDHLKLDLKILNRPLSDTNRQESLQEIYFNKLNLLKLKLTKSNWDTWITNEYNACAPTKVGHQLKGERTSDHTGQLLYPVSPCEQDELTALHCQPVPYWTWHGQPHYTQWEGQLVKSISGFVGYIDASM